MPPDPELVAETRAWLAKALNGHRAAEALKGFLTQNGCTFRKTHNLEEIGERCLGVDPSLREAVDQAVPLNEYAWMFRYPGEPARLGPEEVLEALAIARGVVEAEAGRMPAGGYP